MTHRTEIQALAAKVGADVFFGKDGQIARVTWGWNSYGNGCLKSLICFAEKARAA